LARLSWVAPLVILALNMIPAAVFGSVLVREGLVLLFAIGGVVVGLVALAGVRRYGRKRILAPALIGVGVSGLIVLIWVTNFLAAYARSRAAAGR
jgi:hypothetical protein